MYLTIPGLLTKEEAADFRGRLAEADWEDGRATAGYLARQVKKNGQLPETSALSRALAERVMRRLEGNARFMAAALPLKVVPPLFNRYGIGESYGMHVDGAIRPIPGSSERVRNDLSATLFLAEPEDYDGGELLIESHAARCAVKLAAGDLVLYPTGAPHCVTPVTRGTRYASFFWVQSMVREQERRTWLFELDGSIQRLAGADPTSPELTVLTGLYHNLLRQWAES
jgi:PKHD-type hydroxylase